MKIKDIKNELETMLENDNNHVSQIVIKETLDCRLFDEDNLENEVSEKEIEDLIEDMTRYFDQEYNYDINDMISEIIHYSKDFDEIFKHNDNIYSEDYVISNITNTICDMYIMAYKLETNNILGCLHQIIINRKNK